MAGGVCGWLGLPELFFEFSTSGWAVEATRGMSVSPRLATGGPG